MSCFGGVPVVHDPVVIAVLAYLFLPSRHGTDCCVTSLPRSLLRLHFQQLIVEMIRTWRNSAGSYNWYDSGTVLPPPSLLNTTAFSRLDGKLESMVLRGPVRLCPSRPLDSAVLSCFN